MKKNLIHLLCTILLLLPTIASSQVSMDMEVLGGVTINGNNNNYSDGTYSFELKDGVSYGLGFDIWFPKDFGLSFGYRLSQSATRNSINYPQGFIIGSSGALGGVLKDRIFYIGAKKQFFLDTKRSWSVIPHLGFSYNPFFFDSEDREYNAVSEYNTTTVIDDHYVYNRFNKTSEKYLGSFGGRIGVGIEKEINNIGTFSLGVVYTMDLTKSVDRILYVQKYSSQIETSTGVVEQSFVYSNINTEEIRRNYLLIEVGFKMPCSILLSKGKK
ncbi:MAG: hypothetical protein AB8B56_15680 [Crocinitomicaceae bacterium]